MNGSREQEKNEQKVINYDGDDPFCSLFCFTSCDIKFLRFPSGPESALFRACCGDKNNRRARFVISERALDRKPREPIKLLLEEFLLPESNNPIKKSSLPPQVNELI
jgi:hypothetical protein